MCWLLLCGEAGRLSGTCTSLLELTFSHISGALRGWEGSRGRELVMECPWPQGWVGAQMRAVGGSGPLGTLPAAARLNPKGKSKHSCLSIKWKWKALSRVWLFATPWTMKSMEFSRPNTGVGSLSLLHGIFLTQGSNPGHPHCRQILYQLSHTGKPKNIGVRSLSLLQGIFLTRESNWGLLHCRVILYQLSYQGSPCLSIRR